MLQVAASRPVERRRAAPELAIVVPTFNERANVEALVHSLDRALAGIEWEVVFVDDDSPDGTAAAARRLAHADARVRVLQRVGRRGLASACIEGMLATAAPRLAVLDGDLQHDERLLPRMLELLRTGRADVVVGSRYVRGGSVGAWDPSRLTASRLATCVAERLLPTQLADPMSGFFMLSREVLESRVHSLSSGGFKILLDLVTAGREPLRVVELPYEFRARRAGESKLDAAVAWEFAVFLASRLLGRRVPVRFIAFAAIGATGVLVHVVLLRALLSLPGWEFVRSQAIAALGAMVWNYSVNNALTYRDRRLRGGAWLRGLASFVAVCSVGLVANVGVGAWLFGHQVGWAASGLAGVLVGAVWNYGVTAAFTWGTPSRGGTG